MGKNVAVFVDVANIFYAAKAAGVDIDYVTLLKASSAGRDLVLERGDEQARRTPRRNVLVLSVYAPDSFAIEAIAHGLHKTAGVVTGAVGGPPF